MPGGRLRRAGEDRQSGREREGEDGEGEREPTGVRGAVAAVDGRDHQPP